MRSTRWTITVYIVGGFTRDLLLDSELQRRVATLDMDVVIEGDAIAFAHHMQNLYGGRVVPHRRFRTAKWMLDDPDFPVDTDRLFEGLGRACRYRLTADQFRLRYRPHRVLHGADGAADG